MPHGSNGMDSAAQSDFIIQSYLEFTQMRPSGTLDPAGEGRPTNGGAENKRDIGKDREPACRRSYKAYKSYESNYIRFGVALRASFSE